MNTAKLRVTQVRSAISKPWQQQRVVKGLGLRGIGSSVTVDNTPSFRGMIKRLLHLVTVESVAGGDTIPGGGVSRRAVEKVGKTTTVGVGHDQKI